MGKKMLDDVFNQKYGKDASNKMDWINTVKGQAETFFKNGQYERSTDNIEQARTLLDALNVEPINTMEKVKKFIPDTLQA
jgi:hypothetical protein